MKYKNIKEVYKTMETLNINTHADASLKHYFYQKNRFSDMINAICFNGEEVVLRQSLHSEDSDVSIVFDFINKIESLNATRDIIMKTTNNGIYIIIAIENQIGIDYTMPLRTLLYDSYTYMKQHEKYKKLKKKNPKMKLRLSPLFTIVLYYGEKEWKAPTNLHEMMDIPEKYKRYVNDWNAHVVDLKHIDINLFHNKDNQDIINGLQLFYQNQALEKIHDLTMIREDAITLSAIIDKDGELLKSIYKQEGGMINMCTSIDNLRMNAKMEGKIEGKLEEKTFLLLKLLQNKLGSISHHTKESIKICSSDNSDILIETIFTIQNEQDIINILEKN